MVFQKHSNSNLENWVCYGDDPDDGYGNDNDGDDDDHDDDGGDGDGDDDDNDGDDSSSMSHFLMKRITSSDLLNFWWHPASHRPLLNEKHNEKVRQASVPKT